MKICSLTLQGFVSFLIVILPVHVIWSYIRWGSQDNSWDELSFFIVSSPEHEVLMVSYCDQSMSVVRRQQFVLKANSS